MVVKRFDWMLLLYVIVFTIAIILGLKYSLNATKNILSTFGIIFCLLIIVISRVKQKKIKKIKKVPVYIN